MKRLALVALALLILLPATAQAAKKDRITGAFGMNIHLRQRIPESDWDTVMDKAAAAGVQWGREEFNWEVIEPTDDNFSFDSYDAVVEEYEERGIRLVGLLTYSSNWASTKPSSSASEFYPPSHAAWKNYVRTVSQHYAGRVDHWEIWNEPNHSGFWKGSTQDYVDLLEVTEAALEKGNPKAKLVLGGLSGADTDFLADLYQRLDDRSVIDIVAIHPYRSHSGNFNSAPEAHKDGLNRLTTDITNIKSIVRQYDKKTTPIWLTEIGWPTHTSGVSRKEQSQYLTRAYTLALTLPQVKKVFWYSLTDTSADSTDEEANFGILTNSYAQKPSFTAFQFTKENLLKRYPKKNQPLLLGKYGAVVEEFNNQGSWQFAGTECTAGSVSATGGKLKVTYAFTGTGNCYAPIAAETALPQHTQAIRLRVKGAADDTTLRLRVADANGETFQYVVGYLPNQWLTYTVQLSDFANSWNGDGNGIMEEPLQIESIVLDDNDGSQASGTVYFDWIAASSIDKTSLIALRKGKTDSFAYWSNRKKRQRKIKLKGAKKIHVKRSQAATQKKSSTSATYILPAVRSVKFLEEW